MHHENVTWTMYRYIDAYIHRYSEFTIIILLLHSGLTQARPKQDKMVQLSQLEIPRDGPMKA